MNVADDSRKETQRTPEASAGDDAELARVLDACLVAVEAGKPVDIPGLLAAHPALAARLRVCLAGMGLVEREARDLAPPRSQADFETEAPILPQFTDYRVLREVGRGGMGIVYEAEQISLRRRVALKVLPFAATLDPRQMQRFKNEAHAAAHLHHTNIVPVFAVGCERGVHFYVMQFIDGQNLEAILRDMRPGRETSPRSEADAPAGTAARVSTLRSTAGVEYYRTLARFGVQAAEALDHAHQQGVIHRDVKPANLLLDGGGNLWITDFGLAQIRGDHRLTQTGTRVGTLRYMSPEQALARRGEVDHRTDIYALGATLYELLTMRPLFEGSDAEVLLRHIALDDPVPLRQLQRAIPVELEIIVLKALAKDPHERYATAQDMADDLRRFLEDRPIHAQRPSVLERVTKWARRHRSIVRAALGFLILAVFVLAGATLLIYQAKEEAEDALQGEKTARADLETQAKKLKDALKRETDARNALEIEQKKLRKEQENTRAALALEKQASYRQSIALANQEWWDGRASVAERLLNDCPQELCGWEWLYLKRLHMTAVRRLPDERRWYFWRSTMTADGTRLAAACADGFVYVWDTASGRELLKVAGPEPRVHTLTFSPDGRRLAAASGLWWIIQPMPSSTSIKVWDTVSGKELLTLDGQCHTIHQIAFSPDGQSIAAGGSDGMIRVIDAAKGKEIHVLAAHKGPVYAIAFLSDGKRLFSAGGDRRIRHWDLTTGLIAKDVAGPALGNTSAAFGRDGQLLALPASDNTVRIVSAFSGKELRSLHGHTNSVFKLAFSEDGALLASGSADQTVRIWDTATGQEKRVYRGHDGSVADLAFADQGRRLVSLSGDKFLRIWDTTLHQFVHVLEGHKGEVTALDFSPDSSRLASASADKSIRVWDIAARKALHVLTGHSERVEAVAFHPDGKRLASVANDQTVRLWDLTTGKESSRFEHPGRGKDWALAFQQDGKRLAFAAATGLGEIDLGEDKAVARFKPMDQGHRVVLSQDGRYLAVLALDTPTTLWDISSGRKLRPLGDSAKTWGGAFSRDGRLFASCHAPENPTIESEWFVRIVHTADGREIARLRAKQAAFVHLAFSPDASRIATGERDGARIWDARTGHELLRLRGLAGPIRHVVFSPDGRFLAGFDGKNLLLWDSGG